MNESAILDAAAGSSIDDLAFGSLYCHADTGKIIFSRDLVEIRV